MDFTKFIEPELVVLVPVLYALGMMLKQTNKIKDNYIPVILTAVGVALSSLYLCVQCVSAASIFGGIVQGVLVAAAAVYSNQLYKQITKD